MPSLSLRLDVTPGFSGQSSSYALRSWSSCPARPFPTALSQAPLPTASIPCRVPGKHQPLKPLEKTVGKRVLEPGRQGHGFLAFSLSAQPPQFSGWTLSPTLCPPRFLKKAPTFQTASYFLPTFTNMRSPDPVDGTPHSCRARWTHFPSSQKPPQFDIFCLIAPSI